MRMAPSSSYSSSKIRTFAFIW
ncbi:Protein CBG25289 [Caenorhabditis briggsae]|uniref:Protein CBG25289 n=1 Tax=Caenorhabditis briggsae TaxID=6238 RepID=B6ILS4_CAEBR|nr:Protein CBG25289 [Caenorhabditis briggsae]CAS00854.1 Protein CBG25289 [Caenorhabditis briggsae]